MSLVRFLVGPQKKPYIFEASVQGGDIKKQFIFLKELLGKEVKINQVFENINFPQT